MCFPLGIIAQHMYLRHNPREASISKPEMHLPPSDRSSLFSSPWFTWIGFDGIRKAMHGPADEIPGVERNFVENILVHLLDRERAGTLDISEIASFYSFCQRNLSRTRAQIYQDLWVLYMLDELREGYFVEFGACDGKLLSNTLLLEEAYGWTGILAEPNPVWHSALSARTASQISHKCVFSRSGETISFTSTTSMPELSRISSIIPDDVHERSGNRNRAETFEVETVSLNDLLDTYQAPERIDYMSIDTEGSEFEILEAFDFLRRSVTLITVEHAGETEKRARIHDLLSRHRYVRWNTTVSRWDDWYFLPSALNI